MAKGLISGVSFEPTKIAIVDIQHTNFSYILLVNDELKDFDYLYEYAGGVTWYRRDNPDDYDGIYKSVKNLFGDLPIVHFEYATDYLIHREDLDTVSLLLFGNQSRSEERKMWHKVIMTAEEDDVATVLLSEAEYAAVKSFLSQIKEQRCLYTWVGGHWCISSPCATKEEAIAVRVDPEQ